MTHASHRSTARPTRARRTMAARRKSAATLAMTSIGAAALLVACGGSGGDSSGIASAGGISRIEITSRTAAFNGASFGSVGAYEYLKGKAYGTLDPANPAHARMALIDKAQKNARGLLEYSVDINILRPVDSAKGNGKLFYDVVNRGNPTVFGILNKGSATNPGNGFLMRQGYSIVWSGWQPEANSVTAGNKVSFPIARNGDQPIVQRSMEVLIADTPQTGAGATHIVEGNILTASVAYEPSDPDIAKARVSLTVRQNYDDARVTLNPAAVSFLGNRQIRLDMGEAVAQGFDPGAIYELVYDAKDPYVGGMGFASVRDLVSFLRYQTRDSAGNENPARPGGMEIKAAFGWGLSQSGRFLRDFLYQGFHVDLNGKMVFEGIHPTVAGSRMTEHNMAFAQTSRWMRQHEERNYPGAEFPFTYPSMRDTLSGKSDGVLALCEKAGNCPKVMHQDSAHEIWHGRSSLVVTDTEGKHVDMAGNVRVYMISGQQHGPGNGTANPLANCKYPSDPVDGSPILRAIVVAMDDWVTKGIAPPPSMFPNQKDGTLQTIEQAKAAWPTIPGEPFNERYSLAQLGDYSTTPPTYGASYPVYVAKFDANGTGIGGIIPADLMAPLGTYMGRNFRKAGHAENELCAGSGGFIALPKTLAERTASGDSRPSLEELYPGGATDFYAKRRAQVQALIARKLVLPEELDSYTNQVAFPQ
ncbi:alpha/beta hydrolase domain-containing protein [Comamonas humi]